MNRARLTYIMMQQLFINKQTIISCSTILGTISFNLSGTCQDILKYSIEILKLFKEGVLKKFLSLSNIIRTNGITTENFQR